MLLNWIDQHPTISVFFFIFFISVLWLVLEVENAPYCDENDF